MFGEVASVEVLKERDGSYRGFAFVTFFELSSANRLLAAHHTYLDGIRMEAKPCVQPRGELELDKKIEAILATPHHQNEHAKNLPQPAPTVPSVWGMGPPRTEWRQAEADSAWPAIREFGDVFDPERPLQVSANASQVCIFWCFA